MTPFLFLLGVGAWVIACELYLRLRCTSCKRRIQRDGYAFCRKCLGAFCDTLEEAPREVLLPAERGRLDAEIDTLFREAGCGGEMQR